jgi:predicted dehydrogenase
MINKENRLLRVGVVGCGPIAQFAHFESCRKARNAELYAICDVAQDLLSRMAAIHQPVKTFGDFDAMLQDPNVEAVIVATSDPFHVPLAARALDAGKHVLVEKPLGVSVEECESLRANVQKSNKVLQVANMKRMDPGIAFAHDFIRDQIGQVLAIKAWYCDSTYRYTMTDNLQPIPIASKTARKPSDDPKRDKQRYFLFTHGSHLVDTVRFLGGKIESVRSRHLEKFGAHCWFVEVNYASGAVGHLDLTIAVRMDFHEGFQVYGEHGSVLGRTYLPWFFKASDVECFSTRDGQYHRPLGADGHFYRRQVESWADAILHNKPSDAATVEDGTEALRALVAIARSSKSGETVRLTDATGGP